MSEYTTREEVRFYWNFPHSVTIIKNGPGSQYHASTTASLENLQAILKAFDGEVREYRHLIKNEEYKFCFNSNRGEVVLRRTIPLVTDRRRKDYVAPLFFNIFDFRAAVAKVQEDADERKSNGLL